MSTRHKGPRKLEVTHYDSARGARDDSTPDEETHEEPRHKPQPVLLATHATPPTLAATPTTTTTSAPQAYSASTLALPHDTDDGMVPSSCDNGTAPSSCEDSSFLHLHRAAPDDGTTPPSCDADGIVPLRPSDSAAPSDAAPPRNVAHSDPAPPRNVAHSDAAPPRNIVLSKAAAPRNVVHSDTAPPCDITQQRRSMEQRGGGYGNTGWWEEGRKWKANAPGTCL